MLLIIARVILAILAILVIPCLVSFIGLVIFQYIASYIANKASD